MGCGIEYFVNFFIKVAKDIFWCDMNYKTVRIRIAYSFALFHTLVLCNHNSTYTWLSCSHLKYKPKYTCLFIFAFILRIFIASNFPENHFVVALILDDFFFSQLSQVWYRCAFLNSPWSFQTLNCSSASRSLSENHSWFLFWVLCLYLYIWIQPWFLFELDYLVDFFSINAWSSDCFRALVCMT